MADHQRRSPPKPRKSPKSAIVVPGTWLRIGATEKKRCLETTVLLLRSCKSMDAFVISSLPSLCWRRCKWQGPFAPRTLLRFLATTDPAATLSPSADFPVLPVIRPTLLRRFLAGTRRASPVAWHVLVTVLSLPPRQGEQPCRSDFGCSCCLRPTDAGSALGDIHFRGHNAFTFVTAR